MRRVARIVREILGELGVTGWPKTSGGNGLHVYVRIEPRWGFAEVRRAAHAFAREVERRAPDHVTTTWWPVVLGELRHAAERVPVLITCRPDRSSMLFSTYGFEGAERNLRASGAICVPFLSPAAARIALLCALGGRLDLERMRAALAQFDAR